MMSVTVLTTGLTTGSGTAAALGARWCRAASRARRSATPTGLTALPMTTTLLNSPGTIPSDHDHLPASRYRADRPVLRRSARPPAAGRRADRGVRPRGRRRRQGRRRPAVAAVPAGRPRVRRAAARGQEFLAEPGAEGLPGPAARPARHRPVLPGEPEDAGPARGRGPAGAGRLPDPFPRRQHRARRRADQARADRQAVELARAGLRRHVRGPLPVVRAHGVREAF